jgi:hypothetical protein
MWYRKDVAEETISFIRTASPPLKPFEHTLLMSRSLYLPSYCNAITNSVFSSPLAHTVPHSTSISATRFSYILFWPCFIILLSYHTSHLTPHITSYHTVLSVLQLIIPHITPLSLRSPSYNQRDVRTVGRPSRRYHDVEGYEVLAK